MTNNVKVPISEGSENTVSAPFYGKPKSKSGFFNLVSSPFSDMIGKGDQAKDSVVWYLITRMVRISAFFITVLFAVDIWKNNGINCLDILKQVWGVFAPIITLSMGYLFGKRERSESSKE
ncbi:hypothetical protein D3C78_1355180 [compost metagenome]